MDNAIETLSSTGWLTIPGLVVLGLAGLYLIQGTWSGWKQGFPRKLANLVILSATSWTSWYFRSDIAGFLESRIQVPKLALELASFFYSFLISYLVLLAIAYCIFKKTRDVQGGGMGYGIGGAVLGFATNLGVLALFALGTRYAYEFFNAWEQVEGKYGVAQKDTSKNPIKPMPRWVEYMGGALSFVNQTPLTEVVSNIEPLDTRTFRIASKLTFFTRNRKARNHFMQSSEARQLLNSPRVRKLLKDSDLISLVNQGQWQKLGNQKAVLDALSEPSAWEGIDIEKLESAIDQAITEANAEPPLNPEPAILKPDTLPIRKKVKPDANLSSID